jgi:hypothetical protein
LAGATPAASPKEDVKLSQSKIETAPRRRRVVRRHLTRSGIVYQENVVTSVPVQVIELSDFILALDEISEFLGDRRVHDKTSLRRDDAEWMLEWVAKAADRLQQERDRVIASVDIGGAS